jgi:hypothetical protein
MRLEHEGSDYIGFGHNDARREYEEILLAAYERSSPLSSSYRATENSTVQKDLENIAEFDDDVGYVERHHILPVSLGGTKKIGWVTIKLSAQEHFRCHQLLPEFTVGEDHRKMFHALGCMMMQGGKKRILTPEQYEIVKRANKEAGVSDATRKKISDARRGKRCKKRGPRSAEVRSPLPSAERLFHLPTAKPLVLGGRESTAGRKQPLIEPL